MTGHAERNYGAWASAGASLSAVLSSACCWIPLLLLSFGASAAGVSATFERYRLPLLVLTGLLLATGFYLVYLRKPHCAPGGACSVPNPKLTRLNKGMLWVATILVAAFAFFPNYVGALFGSRQGASVEGPAVHLEIQGMTCEACAVHIEKELRSVPGVLAAEVLYEERRSIITVDRSSPPNEADLVRAVERAGYSATATREPTNTNFEAGPRSAQ
jgi:copper chaperone CopZ